MKGLNMRPVSSSIIAVVVLMISGAAQAATDPPCPNDGYIPDMMVPNKHVAEMIYRAVGRPLVPWNFKKYPIVVVEDEGDHWSVSQTEGKPSYRVVTSAKTGIETVTISAGGGQLYMDINKCTGAISHAALNR